MDSGARSGDNRIQLLWPGSFGYEAEHYESSMQMAELSLLPAIREAGEDTLIVADGTSCRAQIKDGAAREGWHVARVLERAL